jgi:DNA repair protein RecN (Recombination protein N)
VTKTGNGDSVTSELTRLSAGDRVQELARMLGGAQVTPKTRAHAKELLAASLRSQ